MAHDNNNFTIQRFCDNRYISRKSYNDTSRYLSKKNTCENVKYKSKLLENSKLYIYIFTLRMLESDWLMNVLRCAIILSETHGERSSRHRITRPYHFAKWLALFQRSLQPKTAKESKPGQTNKYSKQKNKKIDRSYPCFCHKITLHVCMESTYSTDAQFAHTLTLEPPGVTVSLYPRT